MIVILIIISATATKRITESWHEPTNENQLKVGLSQQIQN